MLSPRRLVAATLLLSALTAGCSTPPKPKAPELTPLEIPAPYDQALTAMHDQHYTQAGALFDQVAMEYAGTPHAHQARLLQTVMDYTTLKIQDERLERYRADVDWWQESLKIDEEAIAHYRDLLEQHKDVKLESATLEDRERILSWRREVETGPAALASRIERESPRVAEMGRRLESEREAMMETLRTHLAATLMSYDPARNQLPYIPLRQPKPIFWLDFRRFFQSEAGGQRWEEEWRATEPILFARTLFELKWRYLDPGDGRTKPISFKYEVFFQDIMPLLPDGDPLKAELQQKASV